MNLSADSLWGAMPHGGCSSKGTEPTINQTGSIQYLDSGRRTPVLVRGPLPRLLGHEFFVLEIARQSLSKFFLHPRERRQMRPPSGLFLLFLFFEVF